MSLQYAAKTSARFHFLAQNSQLKVGRTLSGLGKCCKIGEFRGLS